MKKFTSLALILALGTTTAQANYTLSYDAADGSLTIVADGDLAGYEILSPSNSFVGANHVVPAGLDPTASNSAQLQGNNRGNIAFAGTYWIGNVLAADLTQSEFNSAIGSANYETSGSYINDFTQPFDLQYVPEPSSLALLGLGGLLIARRRRG